MEWQARHLREDAMDQFDFNKLWQNFVETISKHYVDFDGRVGRAQFWCYIGVYFVVGLLVSVVGGAVGGGSGLRSLYGLALLLPSLGITSRRLHDTGRTASWVLVLAVPAILSILLGLLALISIFTFGLLGIFLLLAPIIGLICLAAVALLIYFCVQPGTSGPNEYGAAPAAW